MIVDFDYLTKITKIDSYDYKKKCPDSLRENTILNQAKREVPGFEELIDRFERTISVLGRSQSTFRNYALHVASIALYFGKIPYRWILSKVHDFFIFKKSKHPHKRILNTLFMDFDSA
jgi:hypothetical protein